MSQRIFARSFLAFSVALLCLQLLVADSVLAQADFNPLITDNPGNGFGNKLGGKVDLFGKGGNQPAKADPVMRIELMPAKAQPASSLQAGDEVVLKLTAELPPKSYTYSTNPEFTGATLIIINEVNGLEPLGKDFEPDQKPKTIFEPLLDQKVEKFHQDVTWSRRYRIQAGTKLEEISINGSVEWQVCDDSTCTPSEMEIAAKLDFSTPAPTQVPFTSTMNKRPDVLGKRGPADITIQLTPAGAAPGEVVVVRVKMAVDEGFHTFALTQNPANAGLPTRISLSSTPGLKPVSNGFQPSKVAEDHKVDDTEQKVHHGVISWTRIFEVTEDTNPGEYSVNGKVSYQTCGDGFCYPPTSLAFQLGNLTQPASEPGDENAQPAVTEKPGETKSTEEDPLAKFAINAPAPASHGLWFYLMSAFLGGLILNIMPCVLPVVAIKAISFVQQAGESRGRIMALNIAYSTGVVGVFLILATLAVFAQMTWGGLFQSTLFNLIMICIVFSMGLCLLGVFELPIPGFAGAGAGAQQEGLPGAFLTGIFATLLATPCSGPFLGITFAWSVQQTPAIVYLVWGVMGIGMASPYLVFAFFPAAINKLPRPGNWMVVFKHFAGFTLIGTCIFLIYFIEEAFVVPALIMMLGLGISLWMMGTMYHPGSPASRKFKVRTAALAVTGGLCLLGYNMGKSSGENELPWQEFNDQNLMTALQKRQTVLVDFTADWCLTCKTNEKFALNTPKTFKLVNQNDVVTLKADFTKKDDHIKKWLKRFNSISVPLTVIFPGNRPDQPIVIPDLYTQGKLLEELKGAVSNTPVQQAAIPQPQGVAAN